MKTRLLSILLLLCMIVTAIPAVQASAEGSISFSETVSAAEHALVDIPEPSELPYGPAEEEEVYLTPSEDWEFESGILHAIEQELTSAILNGEDSLDISKYKLDADKINLNVLQYYSPYISGGIDITCWYYNSSYYSRIDITCSLSQREVSARFAMIDAKIAQVNALLDAGKTDLDRALILHDYLAYTGQYDYDNYLNGTIPEDSYRSAGILMDGVGVCQSYAYAFKYFMHREGIECHIVSSDAMNHAWNMIKLGDSYYHIDVTWDDPNRDRLGQVLRTHFLLSDSAISSPRGNSSKYHYSWDKPTIACSSTLYDSSYWTDVKSPICFSGNDRYFIRDSSIIKRDSVSGQEYTMLKLGTWPTWDGRGYWIGSFSGLWLDGSKLYYNTAKELRCIDIYTSADQAVFAPSTANGNVFGFAVRGDDMCYVLKQGPDETGSLYTVPLYMLTGKETVLLELDSVTMNVGDSIILNAQVKNLRDDLDLTWSSDNTSVAAVNGDGTVSARGIGSTFITVKSASGASDKCLVTVTDVTSPDVPVDSSEIFRDVKASSWFKEAVDHAVGNGLMNGTSKDCFEPNAPMNRAMLVTVLWRMEGSPTPEREAPFTDLKKAWYRDAVAWAYSREIVTGTTDTTFSPSKSITREQMAAILYRYSAYKGYDTTNRAELVSYPDASRISPYAVLSMSWANGTGLITGKPSNGSILLVPRGNATRAEVATILMRYFELYNL